METPVSYTVGLGFYSKDPRRWKIEFETKESHEQIHILVVSHCMQGNVQKQEQS